MTVCRHGLGEGYFCRPCAERWVAEREGKTFTDCPICNQEFKDEFPHMFAAHTSLHEMGYICPIEGYSERDHWLIKDHDFKAE